MEPNTDFSILLVDDDDVAREAVVRSFKKNQINYPVIMAEDGIEALEILRGAHKNVRLDGKVIILLDLNMPRMNGFEFLSELRSDAVLSSTVVFVLTTSNADADRSKAYQEHIAGYLVKSVVGPQFAKLASLLQSYKGAVTLPEYKMSR